MAPLPRYALVSPVKDEADHLPLAFASVLAQTHRPVRWVIVDDGSSDGTLQLARSYARAVPWISVVAAANEDGDRARGGRVVRAFERGRTEIHERHEVVVKLDGDIELPGDYFARVMAVFAAELRAGIAGGRVQVPGRRGRWVPERVGRHTVHGAIKAYRVSCLDDFGGLRASMGWDGIDEYGAKARGWKVVPLADLHVRHHARRGSKQRWWRARVEEGRGARYMGYLPSFLLARACYRMVVERPPLLGGAALLAGWLAATLRKDPVTDDPQAVATLRAEQRSRLRRLARGASVPPEPPAAAAVPAPTASGTVLP